MTFTIVKQTSNGPIHFGRHDVASAIERAEEMRAGGDTVSIVVPNGTIYTPDAFNLLAEFYAQADQDS